MLWRAWRLFERARHLAQVVVVVVVVVVVSLWLVVVKESRREIQRRAQVRPLPHLCRRKRRAASNKQSRWRATMPGADEAAMLRSVLLSRRGGVELRRLRAEFRELTGRELPGGGGGGGDGLESYLVSQPGVVRLERRSDGTVVCHAVETKEVARVSRMISVTRGKTSSRSRKSLHASAPAKSPLGCSTRRGGSAAPASWRPRVTSSHSRPRPTSSSSSSSSARGRVPTVVFKTTALTAAPAPPPPPGHVDLGGDRGSAANPPSLSRRLGDRHGDSEDFESRHRALSSPGVEVPTLNWGPVRSTEPVMQVTSASSVPSTVAGPRAHSPPSVETITLALRRWTLTGGGGGGGGDRWLTQSGRPQGEVSTLGAPEVRPPMRAKLFRSPSPSLRSAMVDCPPSTKMSARDQPHRPIREPATVDRPIREPATVGRPLREPATVDRPLREPALMNRPIREPATMNRPIREPAAVVRPLMEPALMDRPLREPATVDRPIREPALMDRPLREPATVDRPIREPALMNRPLREPATVDRPIREPALMDHPIREPTTVDRPIREPTTVDRPLREPALMNRPIREPATMNRPIREPATVVRPLREPALMDRPLREPATVDRPIREPALMDHPLREPAAVDRPIREPATVNRPLREPATVDRPIREPALMDRPLREPATMNRPIREPAAVNRPLREPALMNRPLREPAAVDRPIREPALMDRPLREPATMNRPIREPAAVNRPLREPALMNRPLREPAAVDCPIRKPAAVNRPLREPALMNRPLREPAAVDRPIREPALMDRPLREPATMNCPIREPAMMDRPLREPATVDRPLGEPATVDLWSAARSWDGRLTPASPLVSPWPPSGSPVERCVDVLVSSARHPALFAVQAWSQLHRLERLEARMWRHYGNLRGHGQADVAEEAEDEEVAAEEVATEPSFVACVQDDRVYRVELKCACPPGKAMVYRVDYGEWDLVPLSTLRPLVPAFTRLPVQAHLAQLADVPCRRWSPELSQVFRKLVEGRPFVARVEGAGGDPAGRAPRLRVSLVDTSHPERDVVIGQVMMGFARDW
ncbi:uncharacterized protein LOC116958223 isoform X2 [Petromyzon marinus]|uniref:uncharacterized protein LOC116958223 isoform X2 n=1 Tax=Petromyzon marinus TaxID=7757 RepID=UPI003F7140B2